MASRWGFVDEPVTNFAFADPDALEGVLVRSCRELERQRRQVKGRTRYHGWPSERRPRRPQ